MPTKANVVLAASVGVIAVLAAVAAVVAVQRDPVALDPGSPEAVAQDYLAAVAAGRYAAAADLLADDSACGLEDLASAYLPESLEVILEDSEVDGPDAVVTVEVTEIYEAGPFGSSGYVHTEALLLRDQGGRWRLTGSPWPMYECLRGDAS